MQLNPARGRKLDRFLIVDSGSAIRFMQLNPARGRKQILLVNVMVLFDNTVYAAQPREGTETYHQSPFPAGRRRARFMQLNPARGRKLHEPDSLCRLHYGLCSSTPRGDGNPTDPDMGRKRRVRFMQLNPARGRKLARHPLHHHPRWYTVYAAQPREGTETGRVPALSGRFPARFMQLNPARGRKRDVACRTPARRGFGLCGSTPRGDGNKKSHARMVTHNDMVYVA